MDVSREQLIRQVKRDPNTGIKTALERVMTSEDRVAEYSPAAVTTVLTTAQGRLYFTSNDKRLYHCGMVSLHYICSSVTERRLSGNRENAQHPKSHLIILSCAPPTAFPK